jgi:[acyl-carrier-protein] S-malonyltransferase
MSTKASILATAEQAAHVQAEAEQAAHEQAEAKQAAYGQAEAPRTAWLFAGQGAQHPGMGKDIYSDFPQARTVFESSAAGLDLAALCFEADAATLADTRYTQPCMGAFQAAVVAVLRDAGLVPCAAAGMSLGEYSALHCAGVLDATSLLELLALRGRAMAEAASERQTPAKMAAVLGLADKEVAACVREVAASLAYATSLLPGATSQARDFVACANFNAPGQVVIAGDALAVDAAIQALMQAGARRCVPLATSGAFHTPLMASAAAKLEAGLERTALKPQQLPVVFNATGAVAADTELRRLLVRQIQEPVLFAQSLRCLKAMGVTRVLEIGPGNTLAGLVRKTEPEMEVKSIRTAADLKEVMEQWAG